MCAFSAVPASFLPKQVPFVAAYEGHSDMADLNHLQQRRADLSKDMDAIETVATASDTKRFTDDQRVEFDELLAEATVVSEDIERLQKRQAADLAAFRTTTVPAQLTLGTDHATERPWGPPLAVGATSEMVYEANTTALGEFAIAVRAATMGQGSDPRLFAAVGAPSGMNTAIPSEGGFAVPQEVAAGIESDMMKAGELLSRVDVRTISGDNMTYNVIDETSRVDGSRWGGVRGYWVDQGTAPTVSQTKLARLEMKLRKVGALGHLTDELVADAPALGGELRALFTEELLFAVEDAIFEGDGAGKPQGFTEAACLVTIGKETGQAKETIVGENITKMWARMPARSRSNAVWLANIDTTPTLAVLTLDIGTAGVRYPYASIQSGSMAFWGRPVIFIEYASTVGTIDDLVLADLRSYRLIRKASGIETASSIHVKFSGGEETFRAFYRVDGQAVPRSSLTPFKGTKDTSPFITLATRA